MFQVSEGLRGFMLHPLLPDLWQDSKLRPVPQSPRLAPRPMQKSYTSRLKIWVKQRTEETQLKFPHSISPKHLHTEPAAVLLCYLSSEFLSKEANGEKE